MKILTTDTPEDSDSYRNEVEEIPNEKPELKPDNNITVVLLVLLALVIAFIVWYNNKDKE